MNDAYASLPEADLLYACDAKWWDAHKGTAFAGPRWTQDKGRGFECAARWGLNVVISEKGEEPRLDGDEIAQGYNSGFQAVNLAALLGARRIVLLGFDMGLAPDGRTHFFGDHPGRLQVASAFPLFIRAFTAAAPVYARAGVEIVNASRRSALECFPRENLESVL